MRALSVGIFLVLWLADARVARADTQVWTGFESQVPVSDGHYGLPHTMRWISELRFAGTNGGVNFILVRGGPSWRWASWFRLNLNIAVNVEKNSPTTYRQQIRAEIEPNFSWNLGPFSFNDRNRLERRWFVGSTAWRYRNQLRVNFSPKKAVWAPFISEELFYDITNGIISENRAIFGISWTKPKLLRIELGYLWRLRRSEPGPFDTTNVITFSLNFSPEAEDLIEFGGW